MRAGDGRKPATPNRGRSPRANPEDAAPGLQARKTAARLLAAVIDKKTPLDGLTDNEHGHPQYLALEARDRARAEENDRLGERIARLEAMVAELAAR